MDCSAERQPFVIDGITVEHLPEKIEGMTKPVICFVNRRIVRRCGAFGAYHGAGQCFHVVGGVNCPLLDSAETKYAPSPICCWGLTGQTSAKRAKRLV